MQVQQADSAAINTESTIDKLWRRYLKERGTTINLAVSWQKFLAINLNKEKVI